MKNRLIFLVTLAGAMPLAAEEAFNEGIAISGNMIAACQGREVDEACAIVGALGVETGGHCMVDPRDGVKFCKPDGMPLEAIIGDDQAAELEAKSKG